MPPRNLIIATIAATFIELFYWRTQNKIEVDFILYGENGLKAIEVKRSSRFKKEDLNSLLEFKKDYPEAKCFLIYGGKEELLISEIRVIPIEHS